ncbi:hypothetical protein NFI96_007430 [Prochilodus magdalenae]|nr:hypothetical protein NFI96_007430 [Prochilodus magdalenae]
MTKREPGIGAPDPSSSLSRHNSPGLRTSPLICSFTLSPHSFIWTPAAPNGSMQGLLGVDLILQLGLSSRRDATHSSWVTPSTSSPSLVPSLPSLSILPAGIGVTLARNTVIEAPVVGLLPAGVEKEFSLVVSLRSQQARNAFLFSVRDGADRLQFGLQLLPGRVVVYTGEKASVYFGYEVQDGRWHSFAVGVRPRSVSFHAHCGGLHYSEETLTRPRTVGLEGWVVLGRMNSRAPQFEGSLCQLEIYPSAQVATHYCDYVKKHCRLADTFRSHRTSTVSLFPSVGPSVGSPVTRPTASPAPSESYTRNVGETTSPAPSPTSSEPHAPVLAEVTRPTVGNPLGQFRSTSASLRDTLSTGIIRRVGPSSASLSPLDLAPRITASTPQPERGVLGENDIEDRHPLGRPRATRATPDLTSLHRQSQVKESLRNGSSQQPSDDLLETQLKVNGATLYRQRGDPNQLERSREDGGERTYDSGDSEGYGYDYGFEEGDYFLEYDSFDGLKGDPGPPVSVSSFI